jgi:hypothetical protein
MTSSLLSNDLIRHLDPAALEHYVELTGWSRILGTPKDIALFRRTGATEGSRQELLVPRNRAFADFDERLAEAVEMLSGVEHLSPVEMLNNVLVPSDAMRFRVVSPATINGLLPLVEGVGLYNGMKRTFSAAACDFLDPQSYHARLFRKESEEYLAGCRLGQTLVGSYVATVLCPINPPLRGSMSGTASLFPEVPETQFYRSITARVMQSLEAIRAKLDSGDTELLIRPEKKDLRISGNFFEALTEMRPEPKASDLEVRVSWSHAVAFVPDVPTEVTMLEGYFPELETIAESLRPDFQPQERQLVGKVLALYGDQNDENLMEGEIILRFIDEDNLADARVALRSEDYVVACDAHKLGKYVEVFGTLERMKRRYVLSRYQRLEVLPFYTSGMGIVKKYAKKASQSAKRRRGA